MGILENESIDENKLTPYLKDGIGMNDLINLKKAFISLDHDCDGLLNMM